MKVFSALIEKISIKTIEVLAILLFACITILGAFKSAYLEDGYGLKLYFVKDSLIMNLIFLVVLFVIIRIIADFIAKNMEKRSKILLALVLVYTFCLSLGWAALSKSFPTADQASVYYGAKHFAANYFADIAEKHSYFSCYPHQMGLALFYEVILRIFHTESFHLLQAVNAVCNCITVLSLYKITTLIFEEKKVSVYYLLLMLVCFPLYWYTPFVYGELPSFAFSFFGIWMLLETIFGKKEKYKNLHKFLLLTASIFSLMLATMVRKNTLILIIALVLTMLIYILKERKFYYLIYLAVLTFLCVQIGSFTIGLYEKRAGTQLNAGVPSISHVVMGLQEAEYAPGWYNGFNFNTYAYEAEYNQAEAIRLSELAIDECLAKFKEDPAYAFRFFKEKFMAEWLNTGYACYDSTAGKYYERLSIVESLYSGNGFYISRFWMDKYQFAIYLFALICISKGVVRKKAEQGVAADSIADNASDNVKLQCSGILRYILLVTVLGGAIFYLIWEGSGRYILPYFIMTVPYAAAGMEQVEKIRPFSFKK